MGNTLADGDKVMVKGSSSTYELSRHGSVYACTCPAWRNQGAPIGLRTCKHLRAYLGDLTALDHVHFADGALCFEDLWLRAGLGGSARYAAREGRAQLLIQPSNGNEHCVALPARSGYRVVSLSVERAGLKRARPLQVHLIDRRVIGLER